MSGSTTPERSEYVLSTDDVELRRLREQHEVWADAMRALLREAGLGAVPAAGEAPPAPAQAAQGSGATVLDLGCGPGNTSFELARAVGPRGRVIARDMSERFLAALAADRERLALPWIEPSLGPVEEIDLPPASLDAVYARWVLCWLADPGRVLERAVAALKPGGLVILQEYLDWGTFRLVPRGPATDAAVRACLASWAVGPGTIDVAEQVPELAARCGLRVEVFRPVMRLGAVGSPAWRWLGGFLDSYLPRLVERGLLAEPALDAWRSEWAERERATPAVSTFIVAPTMADVVMRRPRP